MKPASLPTLIGLAASCFGPGPSAGPASLASWADSAEYEPFRATGSLEAAWTPDPGLRKGARSAMRLWGLVIIPVCWLVLAPACDNGIRFSKPTTRP